MPKNLANPMTRFREVFALMAIGPWDGGLGAAIASIGPTWLNFVDSYFGKLSHYATNCLRDRLSRGRGQEYTIAVVAGGKEDVGVTR